MYVRNLNGEEFAAQFTEKNSKEINGNHQVSFTVSHSKVNSLFIHDIEKMWEYVDNDGSEFKIILVNSKGEGDLLYKEIKAIPLFYDKFNTDRIYESHNGSMTFVSACDKVFADTGFTYTFVGSFSSVEWENFGGGETKLETFKRILNRYGPEFELQGNNVIFKEKIGSDTNMLYAHRLNASNITLSEDASEYWTYAKGFGNFEDDEDGGYETAKLKREYTSPLAQVIGIRHAPPLIDGRMNNQTTMDKSLKKIVDDSLKVSIETDMYMLRRQGYENYIPNLGDRIFVQDPRINLDEEVRVVKLDITKDWRGRIVNFQAVLGTEGIVKRQKSKIDTAMSQVSDILNGKIKLPSAVFDNAVLQATKAIQNAQSELIFPESGGIIAVDKTNPNLVTVYNSAGIGISNDGGLTFKNAITGQGIVAEYIMAGTVSGLTLMGSEVIGGRFETTGSGSTIEMENGEINMFRDGVRTSRINAFGQDFYYNNYRVGRIGTSSWEGNPNYRGLTTQLDKDASYMNWGYREDDEGSFRSLFSWHKDDTQMSKGFNVSDHFTARAHAKFLGEVIVNQGLEITGILKSNGKIEFRNGFEISVNSDNQLRIGPDTSTGGTYLAIQKNGVLAMWHNNSFKPLAP